VECARILAKHNMSEPVKYPDFSNKEKAQAVVKQFIDSDPPELL